VNESEVGVSGKQEIPLDVGDDENRGTVGWRNDGEIIERE
jgi:hypothetical protein